MDQNWKKYYVFTVMIIGLMKEKSQYVPILTAWFMSRV